MPDRGLLDLSTIGDAGFGTSDLTIENARWLQVTFEVERQAALAHMPCDVGRPIPPYARLLVAASERSSFAILSVGGRFKMMPRNVVAATVAQGAGVDGLFGEGAVSGSVELKREGQEISAEIGGPDGPLARVWLPAAYAIEPSMLRWDAFVALGRADGEAVLAEVTPSHTLQTAFLSKGADVTVEPSLPRTHPWRRLRSLGLVSACYAEGTLAFSAPVVQREL